MYFIRELNKAVAFLLILSLLVTSVITINPNAAYSKQENEKQTYAAKDSSEKKQEISAQTINSSTPVQADKAVTMPYQSVADKTYSNETPTDRFIIKYKNESSRDGVLNALKDKLQGKKELTKAVKRPSQSANRKSMDKSDNKKDVTENKKPGRTLDVLTTKSKTTQGELLEELRKNNKHQEIEYIQPDHRISLSTNDPCYSNQWGVYSSVYGSTYSSQTYRTDVGAVEAWQYSTGNGAMVAVIDTGIDITHEDLSANIWVNAGDIPGNGLDDDGNGYIDDVNGWDFAEDDNTVHNYANASDEQHGTHVAGIIAAVKDNGKGITGVAPGAKILPLRAFKNGTAYTSDIIEAIEYAAAMGVKIVNCSWGTTQDNPALKEAIEETEALFVCAAGNNGVNIDMNPVYPAAYTSGNIITVASINQSGNLSGFSNFGVNSVDVAAPGEGILSTLPGNGYGQMSGTSMAAPFVSGEAALVLGKYGNSINAKELILNNSDKLTSLSSKVYNENKINCYNSVTRMTLYNSTGRYQASIDYSSVQGQNGWYYVEKTATGYNNMTWDPTISAWRGSYTYCLVGSNSYHPDTNDAVKKWVAPYSGNLMITSNGNVRKGDTRGGDGVKARLYKNNTLLWETIIAWNDGIGVGFPARVIEVAMGDAIYFEINRNGEISCDGTIWDPIIEYKGPIMYQASRDYSSVQGQNNWYYVEKTTNGYNNMTWNASASAWAGSYQNCSINYYSHHPDTNDSVRKWVAPYSGTILVTSSGNIRKANIGGGDGVKARFYKNNILLWETTIAWNDGIGVTFPARVVEVVAGDALYFEINQNIDIYFDSTIWDPIIEYKGPIMYQASRDYSSVQGQNNWYYVEKTANEYNNMTWNASASAWAGSYQNCSINHYSHHPDTNDSVRKWVAPYSGTILVTSSGNIRKANIGGGDGIKARFYKNNILLWETTIAWNDGIGVTFPARVVEVVAGDALYFEINQNIDIYFDSTIWDPIIEYKGPIMYQASRDYSSVQGQNNWYYVEKTANEYNNMTWNSSTNAWYGSYQNCTINYYSHHPDTTDSVRKWVAPYSGNILVTSSGNIRKANIGGGDGVKARLYKNDTLLWETLIEWNDGVGVVFPARVVEVSAGDAIYFAINQNVSIVYDSTIWDPIITYCIPPSLSVIDLKGTPTTLTATIKNKGTATAAAPQTVTFTVNEQTLTGTNSTALAPGQTADVSVAWAPAPGTYTATAAVNGGTMFSNGLTINVAPDDATSDYFGSDFATAKEIPLEVEVPCAINTEGDIDFISFTPTTSGIYKFDITGFTATSKCQVFDGGNSRGNPQERNSFNIALNLYTGQTQYFKVNCDWTDDDGYKLTTPYKIKVSTGTDDCGSTYADARQILANSIISGSIDYWGDNDLYKFNVNVPGYYNISSLGTTDLAVGLTNSSGGSVSWSGEGGYYDNTRGFNINANLASGTYYININRNTVQGDKWSGPYSFKVTRDDSTTSSSVSPGEEQPGSIDYQGDTDSYTFSPELSGNYVIETTGNAQTNITFNNGVSKSGTSLGGNHYVVTNNLYIGHSYGVTVSSGGIGSYKLSIHKSYGDSSLADGDVPEVANYISIGSTTSGYINVKGDVDYYRITPTTSGMYNFTCDGYSSIYPYVNVFDSSGVKLNYSDFNASAYLLQNQTYYIRVTNSTNDLGSYTLKVTQATGYLYAGEAYLSDLLKESGATRSGSSITLNVNGQSVTRSDITIRTVDGREIVNVYEFRTKLVSQDVINTRIIAMNNFNSGDTSVCSVSSQAVTSSVYQSTYATVTHSVYSYGTNIDLMSTTSGTIQPTVYQASDETNGDNNVANIQQALKNANCWIEPDRTFSNKPVTGFYGPTTRASIIKFQLELMGLPPSQIFNGQLPSSSNAYYDPYNNHVGCGPLTSAALDSYLYKDTGNKRGDIILFSHGLYSDREEFINATYRLDDRINFFEYGVISNRPKPGETIGNIIPVSDLNTRLSMYGINSELSDNEKIDKLLGLGINVMIRTEFSNPNGSHSEQINELSNFINKAKARTTDSVVLVGHSKGGIVSVGYAAEYSNNVKKIITVGTPYEPNNFADFANLFGQAFDMSGPGTQDLAGNTTALNDIRNLWNYKSNKPELHAIGIDIPNALIIQNNTVIGNTTANPIDSDGVVSLVSQLGGSFNSVITHVRTVIPISPEDAQYQSVQYYHKNEPDRYDIIEEIRKIILGEVLKW